MWPIDFFSRQAPYAPLLRLIKQFEHFPSHADWDAIGPPARNQQGLAIRFVAPEVLTDYYEIEIAQKGQVATRENNWHDCFNALVWCAFPQSKSAISALHMRHFAADRPRGPIRDAATLLDECGLILPYCDDVLLQLLIDHQWHDLFHTHRADWGIKINAVCFGHANYENLLTPFLGLSGKCWPIKVSPDFFEKSITEQCLLLDQELAHFLNNDQLHKPRQLPPLPYLGIPQWWPEQDDHFYANTQYFRQKRIKQ
ncbi:DUF3025 domain-containing protein [Janthinobacterium sp. B9-8]|uniref:DUF3025 domain-containing protein n=1 Tax=Janthinobacterium sp. B9-8 TaxID=1236179 RepID=UPI00061CF472|nr:DUF3025 domain-containing protein [Janthinobacterium sp. B9-8]AMC33431.1 hypothetical protein VN23_01840 [Janthinobacterium sp. B9-8]